MRWETVNDRDGKDLKQLGDLWDPWYEITYTDGTIMQWHARRRDDGSLFHARWPRELHDAVSDSYLDGKPLLLSLVPPAS